jgi:hypothetical protein
LKLEYNTINTCSAEISAMKSMLQYVEQGEWKFRGNACLEIEESGWGTYHPEQSTIISRACSEHLKMDFKELLLTLKDTKKHQQTANNFRSSTIVGPSLDHRWTIVGPWCERFSRLLALYI